MDFEVSEKMATILDLVATFMDAEVIPIGAMLMDRHAITAEFRTEELLDGLLDEHFPEKIKLRRARIASAAEEDELAQLAIRGMEYDYSWAVIESGIYDGAFNGSAFSTITSGQLAAASGMIMSLLK